MRKDDLVRLRHMLDAARDAISFTRNATRKTLDSDRKLTLSLVKSIEIIGEAASKVSKESREQCPGVPWTDIVAMRNRLIHAYYDIDLDRVWDTVTSDLPPLITELEKIIPKTTG
jgi:uncharacterized protein with HEPN domain